MSIRKRLFNTKLKKLSFIGLFFVILSCFSVFGILLTDNFFAEINTNVRTVDNPENSIKVISYNIFQLWDDAEAEGKANRLLDLLLLFDADIIGFEEMWGGSSGLDYYSIKWFAKNLNMSYYQTPDTNSTAYHGLSLLSKFPILETGYELLHFADNIFSRAVIWATLLTPQSNITFFVTHLDFPIYPTTQINQVKTLNNITKKYSNVILAGDFNLPDSIILESYRLLTEFYEDTWIASKHKSYEGRTWPAFSPFLRVDYILLQGKNWSVVKNSAKLIGNISFSDHLGIFVELSI